MYALCRGNFALLIALSLIAIVFVVPSFLDVFVLSLIPSSITVAACLILPRHYSLSLSSYLLLHPRLLLKLYLHDPLFRVLCIRLSLCRRYLCHPPPTTAGRKVAQRISVHLSIYVSIICVSCSTSGPTFQPT